MIIYNVTVKTEHKIAEAWVGWLRDEHIPAIIATGCFKTAFIFRLLENDESDGITYVIQYHADKKENYDRYINEYASEMRKTAYEKWGAAFIAFRSVMEAVN